MASRNGLNPKIRGPKGVGYGRALPAPFSFGKGLVPPDSSGNYLLITRLINKTWPIEGSIEFWMNVVSNTRAQRDIQIQFNDGSNITVGAYVQSQPGFFCSSHMSSGIQSLGTYHLDSKYHYCFMWDSSKVYAWGNALIPNTIATDNLSSPINLNILGVALCGQIDGLNCSNSKLDELRFYNKKLSIEELLQNDNSGAGNNPSTTENLFAWFQFEKFETLDFSTTQDNSDLRLGIKDVSGNFNHAQVIGMDTNPASGTYVLKPF